MVNSYDNMMGDESDPMDHPAYGGHNDGFNKPRAGDTQMAGDVIPIPGEKSMGSGSDSRAVDYALGKAKDPKVLSIGMPILRSWLGKNK